MVARSIGCSGTRSLLPPPPPAHCRPLPPVWTSSAGPRSRPIFASPVHGARRSSPPHTELREREALKATGLIDAITAALQERGVCGLTASLAAELGVLAIKITHERWIDPANTEDFDSVAHRTLQEIRTANAAL